MSIERNKDTDTITFICDTCGEDFEGDSHESFADSWAAAKREGWRTRKIAGEWVHGCHKPNCLPT